MRNVEPSPPPSNDWSRILLETASAQRNTDHIWSSSRLGIIGSGCSLALAKLFEVAAHLKCSTFARAMTPMELSKSRVNLDAAILISSSGTHPHSLTALSLLQEKQIPTILFTLASTSRVARLAARTPRLVSIYAPAGSIRDDCFVPMESTFALLALAMAFFEIDRKWVVQALDRSKDLSAIALSIARQLKKSSVLQLVASTTSMPSAINLETRLVEYGISACGISDPWNYAHGRYMLSQCAKRPSCLLSFCLRKERVDIERIDAALPNDIAHFRVESPFSDPRGIFYNFLLSTILAEKIALEFGPIMTSKDAPGWGKQLFSCWQ